MPDDVYGVKEARCSGRKTRRFGSRIPAFAWVPIAATSLYVYGHLVDWAFGNSSGFGSPRSIMVILYYLLGALLVWVCISSLEPKFETRQLSLTWRLFLIAAAIITGMTVNTILIYGLLFPVWMGRPVYPGGLFETAHLVTAVTLTITGWLVMSRHSDSKARQALQLQLETDALATVLDNSELAVLQAQIEPHFLFNTLAHIKRQYRLDQLTADQLMTQLIDYLECALPAIRRTDWTLGNELELIQSYLGILEQRFGARLRFEIKADAQCKSKRLPALTVMTLVENAVRHGLAPKAGAGKIDIAASLRAMKQGTELIITVRDDGVGLRVTSGSGLGLATVRARLYGAFHGRALLLVEPNDGSASAAGVCSSICIALENSDAH